MSARKPRRARWLPTGDTMTIAKHYATKPLQTDIEQVLDVVHGAHKALREGAATEQHWSILAGCLDVAKAIERQGVVRGLYDDLISAENALQTLYNRATIGMMWHAPTCHHHELDAMLAFVNLHAFQLRQLGRAEYLKAIASALGTARANGGQATVATKEE